MLAACSEMISGPSNSGERVARVIIAPDSVSLPRGQIMRLDAMVVDRSGSALDGRTIHWVSSDPMHVNVTAAGVVTASAVGFALVSATSEGKADTVKVLVTP
jgi:uncharacterized protein YjdB